LLVAGVDERQVAFMELVVEMEHIVALNAEDVTGAEDWWLRGGTFRTPPGPEGSNGKVWSPGVAARWSSSPFGYRAERSPAVG